MSLRIKFLLAAALSVLAPLLAYLLVDALLMRSVLFGQQAESLRRVGLVFHASLDACERECKRGTRKLVTRFKALDPDLEVIVLDANSTVVAATRQQLTGQVFHEPGIDKVLQARTSYDWNFMDHGGVPVLDATIPWHDATGGVQGAIHLARSLVSVEDQVTVVQIRHTVFVVLVALLVGTFLSLVTFRLVIRPLTRLDRELRTDQRTPPGADRAGRGDEIDRLSATLRSLVRDLTDTAADLAEAVDEKGRLLERVERFNEELEQEVARTRDELLAAQGELVRAEHLSTIGQLAAGLAHELRNPLFIVRATAEKLGRQRPDVTGSTADMIEEVDRIESIIGQLLELARPLQLEHKQVDLLALLEEVSDQVARALPTDKHINWRVACEGDCHTRGDPALLRQAFLNILTNSAEAIAQRGEVSIDIQRTPTGANRIVVRDTGLGIAADDLARVFEPFFTRKASGTGLGLAASHKILALHGAQVSIDSTPGQGTRLEMVLPAETSPGGQP